MDDLKFSVLSRIHQATRLAPIRRTELLSGAQDVPGTSRAIKELISSDFVREELGSDALYIQPPGTAALEAEIERRSAAQVGSSQFAQQLAALQRIADATRTQAETAVKQARDSEEKAAVHQRKSRLSAVLAVLSAIATMLMWLIPGEKAISLLRKGYELLSQGLRLLSQG